MSQTIGKKSTTTMKHVRDGLESFTCISLHLYIIHMCKHEDTDGLAGSNFVFELITSTKFDMALSGNATYKLISYASVNRLNGYHFVSSYHTPHTIHHSSYKHIEMQ